MRRSGLLLLVPALLVGGVVAVTVSRLFQVPDVGSTAPDASVQTESLGGVRFEFEHRPGSGSFEVARMADALSVRRGEDRFEFTHRIPFVNATAFPSPEAGETVRWNLDGPLLVGGRPVEPHRFQPRQLDAAPTELMWDIKNPSDAPRDSLSADWSLIRRVLVTAHGDGVIRVWDVEKRTVRTEITPPAPTDGRKRWGLVAAVSPDGKMIAAANVQASAITLWEADSGKLVATLDDKPTPVTALRFAVDGHLIETRAGVASTRDMRGDRSKYLEVGRAEPDTRAVFPGSGSLLTAVVDAGGALTLDEAGVPAGRLMWRSAAPATALVFFRDRKTLAVGGADGLRLYDVETRRERGWVKTLSIRSLAVSGDGAFLAAAMEHGPAVLLWRIADLQPR